MLPKKSFVVLSKTRRYECEVFLVGDETRIRNVLQTVPAWEKLPVHIVHASETIDMHDQPGVAIRRKKDASTTTTSTASPVTTTDTDPKDVTVDSDKLTVDPAGKQTEEKLLQ